MMGFGPIRKEILTKAVSEYNKLHPTRKWN